MQLSHTRPVVAAVFDDPNLVSVAGLVPLVRLAQRAGLTALAQDRLTVPTDKGANAGGKVMSLVAGMAAGADSFDDMALLRHGAMGRLFDRAYAPSTLGSFLRAFTFGLLDRAAANRPLKGSGRDRRVSSPALPPTGPAAAPTTLGSSPRNQPAPQHQAEQGPSAL